METTDRDALTGAFNRASLNDRLQAQVESARLAGNPLALILIDLDHFKSVNDAFGHSRGDEVLLEFVNRMRSMIRSADLLFRYGGDEFVVVMPNTLKEQAVAIAERILASIRSEQFPGDPPLTLSLSIGVAELSEAATAESLFEKADSRLRDAKRRGRGGVVGMDPRRAKDLDLGEVSRLVEREAQVEAVHHFLEAMLDKKRGVLRILGSPGSGTSRFLAEVGKAAHLRGYEVLSLQASFSLSRRAFGALAEAGYEWAGEPLNSSNVGAYIRALPELLEDQGRLGLMILVDELPHLDLTSLQLIRELLASPAIPYLALAFTADESRFKSDHSLEAPLQEAVTLSSLSQDGLRILLREVLEWEPEEAFLEWFYGETGGLPASIHQGLQYLVKQGVLAEEDARWTFQRDFDAIRLADLLDAQRAPRPNNLPPLSSFVGRDEEIQSAKTLLGENRQLTLLGPGGIGKTHFALQLAAEELERFADGAFYVPLAPLNSADFLVPTIAGVLNFAFFEQENPQDQLLNYLSGKEMLLVLDNFEHLLGGADFIREALKRAPGLSLLVTSREPLNLQSETELELQGMAIPEELDGSAVKAFSAVQLFIERASRAQSDFVVHDEEMPYLVRICQLVEGMPLGIELAAAWAQALPCRSIAEGIESNLDFLRTSRPDVPERHRSLRAVFDHFWGSLSESERSVLRSLSLFRGGFKQETAQTIAGASFFFLSALVDKSLLRKSRQGRYEMHEVLRQYAEEEHQSVPEQLSAARDRYCGYFAAFLHVREAGLKGEKQRETLEEIGEEIENVRMAWKWAVERRDPEALERSLESVFRFYDMRNRFQEGQDVFREAAEAMDGWSAVPEESESDLGRLRGSILSRQGRFLFRLSQYEQAEALLEKGLSYLKAVEADGETAFVLNSLGDAARVLGNYSAARRFHQRALKQYRETGNQSGVAVSHNHLGIAAASLGEFRIAKGHFQESLQVWREIGNRWSMANALNNLGNVASLLGEDGQAKALFQESQELCREIGDRRGVANALNNLGLVSESLEEFEDASQLYQESVATYQEIGDQRGVAISLVNLGKVTHKLGEPGVAKLLLHEAVRTGMAVRAIPVVLEALVEVAALMIGKGDALEATHLLSFALRHPATDQESRDRAEALLEAAGAHGEALAPSLDEEVEELEAVVHRVLEGNGTPPPYVAALPRAAGVQDRLNAA